MKELILKIIDELENSVIDERVKEFAIHNKYAILKDSVTVTVRKTNGMETVIDVTDLVL